MKPTRSILAMMSFAVAFALIGHTVNSKSSTSKAGGDVKIILGGAIGTVLLTLLGEGGDAAASFAKGLAGVTLLSSIIINGKPVFGAVSHLTGPAAPTATTVVNAGGPGYGVLKVPTTTTTKGKP